MKTAVCCIVKNENDYLKEFVNWYRNLGFDNIILYDNNNTGGEDINSSIGEYIDNGYVIVNNIKDKQIAQLPAYNDCIKKYGHFYDWIAFFDIDEHLHLTKHNNIESFLSTFDSDVDSVLVNWMVMDDNDLVYNDRRPLEERFTRIAKNEHIHYNHISENQHIKTILKCTDRNVARARFPNPHFVTGINKTTNANNQITQKNTFAINGIFLENAYLKHFSTKTITEWCYNKMVKGSPDISFNIHIKERNTINAFFVVNEKTDEKMKIVDKFLEEYGEKLNIKF